MGGIPGGGFRRSPKGGEAIDFPQSCMRMQGLLISRPMKPTLIALVIVVTVLSGVVSQQRTHQIRAANRVERLESQIAQLMVRAQKAEAETQALKEGLAPALDELRSALWEYRRVNDRQDYTLNKLHGGRF